MAEPSSSSSHRLLWITLSLFGLVALGVILLVIMAGKPRPFVSAPDEPRPWARVDFETTLTPGRHLPIPDLSALPVPTVSLDTPVVDGKLPGPDYKVRITLEHPSLADVSRYYEVFPADPSGTVTLPDGTRLTLTAVALMLPSDADPEGQHYQQEIPDWRDPVSGAPLPEETTSAWEKKEGIPRDQPRLLFRVEKSGNVPLYWHWSTAYDSRTLLRVSHSSSWSSDREHGMFGIDLDTWHQAPVEIGVQFAFGQPLEETLELETGAQGSFGNLATVSLLETLPFGHGSSSWGGGSSRPGVETFRVSFDAKPAASERYQRSHLLQLWPPVNHYLINGQLPSDTSARGLTGNYGITALRIPAKIRDTSLTLRRYPRLGRAVFSLDALPRLPEVDNLFAVPMGRVTFDYPGSIRRAAIEAAGVRERITHHSTSLPDSMFPLVLEDTTPAEILAEYEKLSGTKLYFDPKEMTVSDQRSAGFFSRIGDWWKANKPSWLP